MLFSFAIIIMKYSCHPCEFHQRIGRGGSIASATFMKQVLAENLVLANHNDLLACVQTKRRFDSIRFSTRIYFRKLVAIEPILLVFYLNTIKGTTDRS